MTIICDAFKAFTVEPAQCIFAEEDLTLEGHFLIRVFKNGEILFK